MKIVIYRATRKRAAQLMFRNKIAPAAIAIALCGGHPPPVHHGPHHHHYTTHEREVILAKTIWAEDRSGGEVGMLAVAHVILNRVHADRDRWGHHIEGVVQKPWQFTCWRHNDPNYHPMMHVESLPLGNPDRMSYAMALQIAHVVIQDDASDPTKGGTYYFAASMPIPPAWAKEMKHTASWGGHEFYRPWTAAELFEKRMLKEKRNRELVKAAKAQGMTLEFVDARPPVHHVHHVVKPKMIKVEKPKIEKPKPAIKPAKVVVKHHNLDAIVMRDTKTAKVTDKKHAPADGRRRSS